MKFLRISICTLLITCIFHGLVLSDDVLCSSSNDGTSKETYSIDHYGDMKQSVDMNCGPNCLWQIMRVYNKDYSFKQIVDAAGTSGFKGTSIKGMVSAANEIGLPAIAIKTNLKNIIKDRRIPILMLNLDQSGHYVILDSVENDRVRILDSYRFIELSMDELSEIWDGYAIMIGSEKRHILAHYQYSIGLCIISVGILILLIIELKKRSFPLSVSPKTG